MSTVQNDEVDPFYTEYISSNFPDVKFFDKGILLCLYVYYGNDWWIKYPRNICEATFNPRRLTHQYVVDDINLLNDCLCNIEETLLA